LFPPEIAYQYYVPLGIPATGCYVGRNLGISAGYVISREGEILQCPDAHIFPVHIRHMLSHVNHLRKLSGMQENVEVEVKHIAGECALIVGQGYEIYGHWLVDILPKLYILVQSGFRLDTLKFIVPGDLPTFGRDMLAHLGIDSSQLYAYDHKKELVEPELLIVPTVMHNSFLFSELFSDALTWLISRVEAISGSFPEPTPDRRIYLTRSSTHINRPLINREEVEHIAVHFGFEVVRPEKMPIIDQWRTCASSSVIAGEYGSALHSSMFSPFEPIVCGLRGSIQYPGFLQTGIAEMTKQATGYVFGVSEQSKNNGYMIDIKSVKHCFGVLTRSECSLKGRRN
jgi:capsular polysaccharide biosynthesis protein